jgi:hypothetical protein
VPFRHTTAMSEYASCTGTPSYATPTYMYGESPATRTSKYTPPSPAETPPLPSPTPGPLGPPGPPGGDEGRAGGSRGRDPTAAAQRTQPGARWTRARSSEKERSGLEAGGSHLRDVTGVRRGA